MQFICFGEIQDYSKKFPFYNRMNSFYNAKILTVKIGAESLLKTMVQANLIALRQITLCKDICNLQGKILAINQLVATIH